MKSKIKTYIIGILIPLAVGFLSAYLTRGSMDIYSSITRPPLSPPAILFPIVWTVLYILMGIGSVIIYSSNAPKNDKSNSLLIYSLQLTVNFFWSLIFFNKRAFLFSFIWLILLLVLIVEMILSFRKIDKAAAFLQIPYLLWVSFAGYLNLAIYLANVA